MVITVHHARLYYCSWSRCGTAAACHPLHLTRHALLTMAVDLPISPIDCRLPLASNPHGIDRHLPVRAPCATPTVAFPSPHRHTDRLPLSLTPPAVCYSVIDAGTQAMVACRGIVVAACVTISSRGVVTDHGKHHCRPREALLPAMRSIIAIPILHRDVHTASFEVSDMWGSINQLQ